MLNLQLPDFSVVQCAAEFTSPNPHIAVTRFGHFDVRTGASWAANGARMLWHDPTYRQQQESRLLMAFGETVNFVPFPAPSVPSGFWPARYCGAAKSIRVVEFSLHTDARSAVSRSRIMWDNSFR